MTDYKKYHITFSDVMEDSLDFDGLIGEADEYIREHSEEFEE